MDRKYPENSEKEGILLGITMDTSTFTSNPSPTPPTESQNTLSVSTSSEKNPGSTQTSLLPHGEEPVIHHTKNLYPIVRHTILVVCILFFIVLIMFLIHQNGKSIYDNGI